MITNRFLIFAVFFLALVISACNSDGDTNNYFDGDITDYDVCDNELDIESEADTESEADMDTERFEGEQDEEDSSYNYCLFSDISIEILWCGYYRDTTYYIGSLKPEDIGIKILVEGSSVTVTWKAVVYEDCSQPDAACLVIDDSTVMVHLIQRKCPVNPYTLETDCMCGDDDYVSNVSSTFNLDPGSYTLNIDCDNIMGLITNTCKQVTTTIDIY